MRKIASIFLLGILLFNWFGYRLLIGYWQEKTASQLEAKLDGNDYDESRLISVKIPATSLAYYNNSPTFERVDGSVEINGVQYKYVKRRLFNDSLELLCLPDQGAMKLQACSNDLVKIANVLHPGFDPYMLTEDLSAGAPLAASAPEFIVYACHIPYHFFSADERPPAPGSLIHAGINSRLRLYVDTVSRA